MILSDVTEGACQYFPPQPTNSALTPATLLIIMITRSASVSDSGQYSVSASTVQSPS